MERTLAWLSRFRRLTIRCERPADLHLGFLDLACALICSRLLRQAAPSRGAEGAGAPDNR